MCILKGAGGRGENNRETGELFGRGQQIHWAPGKNSKKTQQKKKKRFCFELQRPSWVQK